MEQEKIGRFIAEMRKENSMTQEQLGQMLNVSQRTVSRWETGHNMPDISLLNPLSDALGINVAELLMGEKSPLDSEAKGETSKAVETVVELAKQKRRLRCIIGAVISAVVMIVCMILLYGSEFCYDITTTANLEAAIESYPTNESPVKALERISVGDWLVVLYTQEGQSGCEGLAVLEKGIFGKYRIISTANGSSPVCVTEIIERRNTKYLVVFSANPIRGADRWEVRDGDVLLCSGRTDGEFIQAVEVRDDFPQTWDVVAYYDADGNEVSESELSEIAGPYSAKTLSGANSAELGLIYVLEVIALLLGFVFIRYFLTEAKES